MIDMKKREPGCECHLEEGDSPCIVHGLYEAVEPCPFYSFPGNEGLPSTCTCERDEE